MSPHQRLAHLLATTRSEDLMAEGLERLPELIEQIILAMCKDSKTSAIIINFSSSTTDSSVNCINVSVDNTIDVLLDVASILAKEDEGLDESILIHDEVRTIQ